MKGTLEINIGFLIFLIAILVVATVLITMLIGVGSQQNLSTRCTGIVNAISSLIKGTLGSSEKANFPNSIWC